MAHDSPIRLLECQFFPIQPSTTHHQVRPTVHKRFLDVYPALRVASCSRVLSQGRTDPRCRIVCKRCSTFLRLVQTLMEFLSFLRPVADLGF